ncbi:MAG: hypothetical protein J1G04_02070 [Clostridiales bacterium]|nr:hypothetical protein [Clostridiales bacterium]
MAQNGKSRIGVIRVVLYSLAAAFAVGAIVCIGCYVAFKKDVLFIPMALCAVFALILFTYARNVHDD